MASSTTPPPPRGLGDFVLGRELGRGGMGIVFEARQTSLNRRVAVKVLAGGADLTPSAVLRFRREAEAAAMLHHTNIVPIYAVGETGGTHYYAMELIEGPSLDQVIRRQRQGPADGIDHDPLAATAAFVDSGAPTAAVAGAGVPALSARDDYFDAVARLIAEVADALDYAHGRGVIHRDIKPANLLLSPAGRLSVTDFGLAQVLEQPGVTLTGELVGTPRYMSPEQVAAGRVPVDARTDIYSLGATLYELLALQPAFAAAQRDRLLAQIIQTDPTPPRAVNGAVPVDLETVCLKAMDKDPARRYQTAGQMADDLRRYVNRFPIRARRAGPVARLRKWAKRSPALAAAVAGLGVLAAAAGGLALRSHLRDHAHQHTLATVEQERLEAARRAALDRAVLTARLEDFDGAREAIREAERLGCSAGQLRMLRGQLELYQGHPQEAVAHLSQATELLPDSVAAWGMLAVALSRAGRPTDSTQALGEAIRRPAVTPDDYLFRGHAECISDSARGLASLNEAVRRRPSVLAHLIRTEALRRHILDRPDVEMARLAMADVQSVRRQLADSASVRTLSASVHLTCFHVFDEFRQPALRQAALAEGLADIRALERYPDSAEAVLARWVFLDETDRSADGVADLQRFFDRTRDVYAGYYCALAAYKHGDFDRAARVLDRTDGQPLDALIRTLPLAELPDGLERAAAVYHGVAARDLGAWDLFNSQLILRFLGRPADAAAVSRRFLAQPDRFPPLHGESFRRALEYCAGERSAESLLAAAQDNRRDLCNAHFCIALTALAAGDRAAARRHLRLCVETRHYEIVPYDLSKALLSRMDADPRWPPWIEPRR